MHSTPLVSFLLFCLFGGLVSALSSSGSRLLVLSDELEESKTKYSKLWSDLKDRSYDLTFKAPKSDPALFHLGERTYDHVVILPMKAKALGPALTPQILLQFMQEDGNILLALSADTPTPTTLNSLLLELDITTSAARDDVIVDHFNFDTTSAASSHDTLVLNRPAFKRTDVNNFFTGAANDVLAFPRSVGTALGNSSPLLASILSAPSTAYSYSPKDEPEASENSFASGSQLSLVTSLQARNSARFVAIGSADALSDKWFDASVKKNGKSATKQSTANREFSKQLTKWVFQEVGVLKVENVRHWLNADNNPNWSNETALSNRDTNPGIYRIKNDVHFEVTLSTYDTNSWKPYTPPTTDSIQLEFSMLSPYHRLSLPLLSRTSNSSTYGTNFRLPDQHGIFNFRLTYQRPFITNIDEKRTVTVRHFAHDEWPRSYVISGAYVWIAGIASTILGWVGFCVLWLYSKPNREVGGKKMQ